MLRNVAILLFDQVEVLDFAGPFEVFSVTAELNAYDLCKVYTVGKTGEAITAVNGLSVNPTYSLDDAPAPAILVIPGGEGTKKLLADPDVLDWVRRMQAGAELTMSVCSGARLLGALGLLDGKPYCTHHEVFADMASIVPSGQPRPDQRFIGDGRVYTSGGISAGIDLSFHLVEKLYGPVIAAKTARYMEYGSYPPAATGIS